MDDATALGLSILIPLLGAVVIGMSGRSPNLRESASLVTAGLLFSTVISLFESVDNGSRPRLVVFETFPQVPIAFEAEPLGMLFGLLASFLWIVTTLYSIGYMRAHHEKNQTRFYVCFAVALASTMGVAFAANLFTLFLFYELLTLSTYPLVIHAETAEARRAGRIYLGVLLGTSIGLQLVAIVWTWVIAGSLDFTVGGLLNGKASPGVTATLCALYVFGVGKAALMPFHGWLPAAMVAPTPVSALLHAVAVVKAGVFVILKIAIYVFWSRATSLVGGEPGAGLCRRGDDPAWIAVRDASEQPESETRLLHRQSARLHRSRGNARESVGLGGRRAAYRDAWFWQDHLVLLRRRHSGYHR